MHFFNLFTPARTEIVNKKPVKTTYYSRSAENGTDKVLSRGEENSSVHMTYVNFLKPRKSALDVTLYAASSGRSMVEMLGVLAIIGVLSVGAISSYSKAMTKHKLNKYAEAVNSFINNFIIFRKSLGYTSGSWTPYADILQKLNLIPDGWRYRNYEFLNDNFGNLVQPYHDNRSDTSFNHDGIIFVFDNSPHGSEICQILVQTAKVNSSFIWMLYFQGSKGYYRTYGDNYCTSSSAKCLRNLSIDDIYNLCYTYMGKDASEYSYQIQIVFKTDEYI